MPLKHLSLLLLFSISISASAQKKNTDIVIGKVDSIFSRILNENRKIWVSVPSRPKTGIKYPVLYLLDGDALFHSATGIVQSLSNNGNTILPEMIVVGIVNTNRTRDLTPTGAKKDIPFFKDSGGGPRFMEFIQKELIPFIEKKYPAASHRTIAGHSLGGLMVFNTLFDYSNLFNGYIAIDPTVTWDKQMLLKKAEKSLLPKKLNNKKLFVSIANTVNASWDTATVKNDTSISTYHIRSILKMVDLLKADKSSGLSWNHAYYKDDSHISVALISLYDGLRYIFDFYPIPSFDSFLGQDNHIDPDSLLTAHYLGISKNLGYKVIPDEIATSQLGYTFVEVKEMDKAYSCFKMNIRNYPKSYRSYSSMGDYYNNTEDTAKAIEYYKKSLSIKENKYLRDKLSKLLREGK